MYIYIFIHCVYIPFPDSYFRVLVFPQASAWSADRRQLDKLHLKHADLAPAGILALAAPAGILSPISPAPPAGIGSQSARGPPSGILYPPAGIGSLSARVPRAGILASAPPAGISSQSARAPRVNPNAIVYSTHRSFHSLSSNLSNCEAEPIFSAKESFGANSPAKHSNRDDGPLFPAKESFGANSPANEPPFGANAFGADSPAKWQSGDSTTGGGLRPSPPPQRAISVNISNTAGDAPWGQAYDAHPPTTNLVHHPSSAFSPRKQMLRHGVVGGGGPMVGGPAPSPRVGPGGGPTVGGPTPSPRGAAGGGGNTVEGPTPSPRGTRAADGLAGGGAPTMGGPTSSPRGTRAVDGILGGGPKVEGPTPSPRGGRVNEGIQTKLASPRSSRVGLLKAG